MSEQKKIGRRIGYLRVSTDEQRPDRQIDGLEAKCDELRIEHGVSAAAKSRPVFDALVDELKAGDTLAVWDLDRAFRSTIDAITCAEALRERGARLRIVTMNVDTAPEDGEFIYTVLAGIAQFERRRLARRTKEGLAAARRRGKVLGRPRKLSCADITRARRLLNDPGRTICDVAASFGCSRQTLSRAMNDDRNSTSTI